MPKTILGVYTNHGLVSVSSVKTHTAPWANTVWLYGLYTPLLHTPELQPKAYTAEERLVREGTWTLDLASLPHGYLLHPQIGFCPMCLSRIHITCQLCPHNHRMV